MIVCGHGRKAGELCSLCHGYVEIEQDEPDPPHLRIQPVHFALAEIGVKEWPGDKHNPRILEYHATTTLGDWGRSRDETPWCSSFVNWCHLRACAKGTDNALARSWIRWGVQTKPTPGCVVVLKRRRRGSDARTGPRGGYHVGFYLGGNRRRVSLLSGNASDRVGVDHYPLSKWDVRAHRASS